MKKYLPLLFTIAITCFSLLLLINIVRTDYVGCVGNLVSIVMLLWAKKYLLKK